MKGLFVTGTDTNIGKTWIGVSLISALRRLNVDVIPRKPIESGWDKDNIKENDAWLLANAAEKLDELAVICPNRFSLPISPVRAASHEGQKLSLKTVEQQCLNTINEKNFLYVEGAGGFYSPLCFDGLNADLAEQLKLPILLVAENRLGCINQVLLNIEAIERRGLKLKAIVLNNVSKLEPENMDNLGDLNNLLNYPIIATQYNHTITKTFDQLALIISN